MNRRRSHPLDASSDERSRRRARDPGSLGHQTAFRSEGAGAAGEARTLLLRGWQAEEVVGKRRLVRERSPPPRRDECRIGRPRAGRTGLM